MIQEGPHQDRLASIFLSNTPELNHADARFAAGQAFVDAARQRALDRAPTDKRAPANATETASNQVAGKITGAVKLSNKAFREALQRPRPNPLREEKAAAGEGLGEANRRSYLKASLRHVIMTDVEVVHDETASGAHNNLVLPWLSNRLAQLA